MKTVKAKDIISTFIKNVKVSEMVGETLEFIKELEKKAEEYKSNKDKVCLHIQINTDGDFAIKNLKNGSGFNEEIFEGFVFVEQNESNHDALLRFIDGIKFSEDERSIHILKRLIGDVKREDAKEELNNCGYLSIGGNQTIDVSIVPVSSFIHFGDINIDLTE